MFIGRKEELSYLEERYRSKEAQMIVLYGRRRVGKTETLRKFCEGKQHVFYSCTECPDHQQLEAFSQRMLETGMPASRYLHSFSDWKQAFESVLELPGTGKKLLVIDEFPYMVKGNREIPSILQNLWDEIFQKSDVMMILCGSAMAFMEKEILADKNPLYGRATGILKMREMDFADAIQFVPGYSPADQITTYAVLGGIPYYVRQFDGHRTLAENIQKQILTRGSILYSEVEFLLRQELRETAVYNVIIQAVAMGNTKLNDIFQKTQIEKTKLSVYLKNLIDLGILRREFPVMGQQKEQGNIQRGLYQVTDHYFRFWYAFLFPNISELETGDSQGIWEYVVSPELDGFTSHAFEEVCREYLRRENRSNRLPFHFVKIGRWWKGAQELDILAVDAREKNYILGECKFRNSKVTTADWNHMREKFSPADKDARCFYYLFSRSGFSDGMKKTAREEKIYLKDLQDIVRGGD